MPTAAMRRIWKSLVKARANLGLLDAEELLGRELDGWRLTELLGRGGMRVVFGAERAAATRS